MRSPRQSSVSCLGRCESAARARAEPGGCWHPDRAPQPRPRRAPWDERRQELRPRGSALGQGRGWRRGRSADTGVRRPGDGAAGPARAARGGTGTARPRPGPGPRRLRVATGGSGHGGLWPRRCPARGPRPRLPRTPTRPCGSGRAPSPSTHCWPSRVIKRDYITCPMCVSSPEPPAPPGPAVPALMFPVGCFGNGRVLPRQRLPPGE